MQLGGRPPSAMLGPWHALGHQLNGARVHHMDRALEPTQYPFTGTAPAKARRDLLQVTEDRPKKFFGQFRGAHFVGIRKIIAAWSGRAPNRRERTGIVLQVIAQVIEPNRMSNLSIAHCHHMTPDRKEHTSELQS